MNSAFLGYFGIGLVVIAYLMSTYFLVKRWKEYGQQERVHYLIEGMSYLVIVVMAVSTFDHKELEALGVGFLVVGVLVLGFALRKCFRRGG